ncbi:MAG: hypothetical protein QOD90_2775, partial [Mycobacterium sp.]|nr:hypothetical protein [Mycobacterium sp.]
MLGLVIGTLLIAAESALVYLLKQVAPGNVFGVIFLLGVLVVATVWGFGLGVTMALASAVVYVHFHYLQTGGSIVAVWARNWVAVTVFLVVALAAAALAGLARSRAAEAVERRRQVEAGHDELSALAEQQAALRRVATLVAGGARPADVFDTVADELARCLHVVNAGLLRYEPDGTGFVVAVRYEPGITTMPVTGERIPLGGDDVAALVLRTGRAARIDDHDEALGPEAVRIRAGGIGSIVGLPIHVDDRLWGAAIVGSTSPESMPADTEARVADFADLVATAIANAATRAELGASRDELRALAEQQAALRRVATLVARGVGPSEVFEAVADEMAGLLHVSHSTVSHYDAEEFVPVAICHENRLRKLPEGLRLPLAGDNVAARVFRTHRTARMDSHDNAPGEHAARIRELGIRSAVGVPIIVDGSVWGAAIVGSSTPEPMPADTEVRIGDFADLVATAIANAATRAELQTSRDELVVLAEQQASLR